MGIWIELNRNQWNGYALGAESLYLKIVHPQRNIMMKIVEIGDTPKQTPGTKDRIGSGEKWVGQRSHE